MSKHVWTLSHWQKKMLTTRLDIFSSWLLGLLMISNIFLLIRWHYLKWLARYWILPEQHTSVWIQVDVTVCSAVNYCIWMEVNQIHVTIKTLWIVWTLHLYSTFLHIHKKWSMKMKKCIHINWRNIYKQILTTTTQYCIPHCSCKGRPYENLSSLKTHWCNILLDEMSYTCHGYLIMVQLLQIYFVIKARTSDTINHILQKTYW